MLREIYENRPGLFFVAATLLPLASFVLVLLASSAWCLCRRYRDQAAGLALYNLLGGDKRGRGAAYVALSAIAGSFVLSLTGFILYHKEQREYEHRTTGPVKELRAELNDLEARAEAAGRKAEGLETKVAAAEEEVEAARKQDKTRLAAREADLAALRKEAKPANAAKEKAAAAAEAQEKEIKRALGSWEDRRTAAWKGQREWLRVSPAGMADPSRGTILSLGFYIDNLSALMFVMVTFIATLIHLFSMGYMSEELGEEVEDHQVDASGHWGHEAEGHHDPIHDEAHAHAHLKRRGRFGRFFLYLSLFCFSMLNLVLADNLFQVFLSWELVGVCSYLLIGFYFERQSAANAANKAFITNRVGDAGFIIGLLIVWSFIGTFNFEGIFQQVRHPVQDAHGNKADLAGQIVRGSPETVRGKPGLVTMEPGKGDMVLLFPARPNMDEGAKGHFDNAHKGRKVVLPADRKPDEFGAMPYWLLVVAGLGIFLGCVGKSAQFPLQVWLPDAMEGPTPVSALIHAATMVAAGVYLVGRCYPLFTPDVLLVIAYVGGITLFVAATIAVVMTDIKKVLAYSTVSQLGYMMLALGIGGWVAGLFHLMTHAFFKALLFLGSGSVIYGCHHEQEMTKMGGLYDKMKITALTMLMGVLAIAGIPFFSGWYSKDSILAQALGYVSVHPEHALLFLLPLATAGITTFYMFRMWFMTFTGAPKDHHVHEHAHESPWPMTVPLIALATCSVAIGWGWPVWDAKASHASHLLSLSEPLSVKADFGEVGANSRGSHAGHGDHEEGAAKEPAAAKKHKATVEHQAHAYHDLAGYLALGVVALGLIFASLLYFNHVLDPAEAKEQFPRVHAFLAHKWYFDELYSAMLVRPVLVIGRWCREVDLLGIDGILHAVARGTVRVARWSGKFDSGFVDWSVNLFGDTVWAVGARLRGVQTGYLRNYVLFLVLAAVGIFVALSYFLAQAAAGG